MKKKRRKLKKKDYLTSSIDNLQYGSYFIMIGIHQLNGLLKIMILQELIRVYTRVVFRSKIILFQNIKKLASNYNHATFNIPEA